MSWTLDPNVNILIGDNGSGKTTILELLKNALSAQKDTSTESVLQSKCRSLRVHFDNGSSIQSSQQQALVQCPDEAVFPILISTFDSEQKQAGNNTDNEGEQGAWYSRELSRQLDSHIRTLAEVQQRCHEGSPLASMQFQEKRQQIIILVNTLFQAKKKTFEFVESFEFNIFDFERLLPKDDEQNTETIEEFKRRKLLNRVQRLRQQGIPDEVIRNLSKVVGTYAPECLFESALAEIDATQYMSILKPYGSPTPLDDHLAIWHNKTTLLSYDQLSSGERQLLIILFQTLAQSMNHPDHPCIILMDEPEISLHLKWQEELINVVQQVNKEAQIIIATHSPGITMQGWFDRIKKMSVILGEAKNNG